MMKLNDIMKNLKEFNQMQINDIYVSCGYPVLFTGIDEENNLYLFSCFIHSAQKTGFVVSQTNCTNVIDMLNDKITINDVYKKANEENYIITLQNSNAVVEKISYDNMPDHVLPTVNEFIEAEEDEFAEEISRLESMNEVCASSELIEVQKTIEFTACKTEPYNKNNLDIRNNEVKLENILFESIEETNTMSFIEVLNDSVVQQIQNVLQLLAGLSNNSYKFSSKTRSVL